MEPPGARGHGMRTYCLFVLYSWFSFMQVPVPSGTTKIIISREYSRRG